MRDREGRGYARNVEGGKAIPAMVVLCLTEKEEMDIKAGNSATAYSAQG